MDIWGYEYALTSSNSETIVTIDSIVVVTILDTGCFFTLGLPFKVQSTKKLI